MTRPERAPTQAQVRAAVEAIPDPEMPPVTVGDLGMVRAVRVSRGRVEVELIPTFTGCPATAVIRDDVARAVSDLEGVDDVTVRFSFDETWTPARITARGRARLREFAVAPPADRPDGGCSVRRRGPDLAATCPICGSDDTVTDSPFGPTPCRSSHYCNRCRNPFEAIKP